MSKHFLVISRGVDYRFEGDAMPIFEDWEELDVVHVGCFWTMDAMETVDGGWINYVHYDCPEQFEIDNVGFSSIEDEIKALRVGVYEFEFWGEKDYVPNYGWEYDTGLRFVDGS